MLYNDCIVFGGWIVKSKINKLARLIVRAGLNVKKDQLVVIHTHVEAIDLTRAVVKQAYEAGAKDVIVRYRDEIIDHEHYLHADASCFEKVRESASLFYEETAQEGACYLSIIGSDPDLMKDVDSKRMANASRLLREKTPFYRYQLDTMKAQWCVVPAATQAWANKVYPKDENALEKLWEDIFYVCRIDEKDPLDNWKEHKKSFEKKLEKLNTMDIESLHYTNSLGTDLIVKLPLHYVFEGGDSHLLDEKSTAYFANIPTEEVFSAPLKTGVDGRLVASMPLIHSGSRVNDFWFEFKDGKVVDFDAKEGKDVLASILDTDEGARYLGEVALVPAGSPIHSLQRIFYNTLIDENASCHFALGKAYNECIQDGLYMDAKQLEENGLNNSFVHVDFMVGTLDLSIVAKTHSGEQIPIFVQGKWTSLFD